MFGTRRAARDKAIEKTGAKKDWDQDFRATYASLANDIPQLRVRLHRRIAARIKPKPCWRQCRQPLLVLAGWRRTEIAQGLNVRECHLYCNAGH